MLLVLFDVSGDLRAALVEESLLSQVFRVRNDSGLEEYRTLALRGEAPAFRAVVARRWPSGMVPVYAVKRGNGMVLQRFPPRGQEGLVEPLFFGLPCRNERTDLNLLGRWECIARHADGAEEYFSWDLAVKGEEVVGRFDIDTDFRFASIVKGEWRPPRLKLEVVYIRAEYHLSGVLGPDGLSGEWTHVGEEDGGTWEATRVEKVPELSLKSLVALVSYQRADGEVCFRLEGDDPGDGWKRESQNLCRVWR